MILVRQLQHVVDSSRGGATKHTKSHFTIICLKLHVYGIVSMLDRLQLQAISASIALQMPVRSSFEANEQP